MEVKQEKIATPVKFTVVISPTELTEKKKTAFNKVKDQLVVPGFRKGHVTQDVAEDKIGINKLYKSIIDEVCSEVSEQYSIVSSRDFKFFGDFKKEIPLNIEFIAEVKPEVGIVPIDDVKKQISIEESNVTEDDLKKRIEAELKLNEKFIDIDRKTCENLDIAIIDFEGTMVGENVPFKGGTAKGYQIKVNDNVNGKKQFVDNFEDQMVGMQIGESRSIKVKFPDDYRDILKAGKQAVFVVTLNALKQKITPEFNEEFVKTKGMNTIEEFKELLKNNILDNKQKNAIEDFKKLIVTSLVKQADIPPIPENMINTENEREWRSFLRRMDKTEEQFLKENPNIKENFYNSNSSRSTEIIKATLVLEKVAKDFNIDVSEEEIVSYVMRVSTFLKHDEMRKEKIEKDLNENKYQHNLMKIASRNEKVVEFLYDYFTHTDVANK